MRGKGRVRCRQRGFNWQTGGEALSFTVGPLTRVVSNVRFASFRFLFAAILLLSQPLLAEQMVPLPIDWLARKAQLVVQGTVRSSAVQRDAAGRIYTAVRIEIEDVFKGSLATNRFTVVHAGGVLGDQATVVPGEAHYAVGEEVVAFLVLNQRGEGVSIGMLQGKFRVFRDPDTGEKLAQNRFHGRQPGAAQAAAKTKAADGIVDRLTVADLKSRVQGGGN